MGYLKWSRVERVKLRPKGWMGGSRGKNGGGAFRQREDPLSTERRLEQGQCVEGWEVKSEKWAWTWLSGLESIVGV